MRAPPISLIYLDRLRALLASGQRTLLSLAGPPGCGKSTLALALQRHFPDVSVVVPMDGYHLANVELARLGRAERKGAPDTFDGAGYVALLQRLRRQSPDESCTPRCIRASWRRALRAPSPLRPALNW